MSMLSSLAQTVTRSKKRVGRGIGSAKGGHTSGRGQKGQKSRQGSNVPTWFEGGQLPLIKRLPMLRGKGRLKVVRPTAQVTLSHLQAMKATEITLETLKLERVISSRFSKAKVISSGSLERPVMLRGVRVSAQAKKAIEKVGGSVEV